MKNFLQSFEKNKIQKIRNCSVGDFLKVGFLFQEGEKKRIQFFEGIIIAINRSYLKKKITLRKLGNSGVEYVFSCQSPQIQSFQVLQSQKFCRSKLFFLRKRIGKAKAAFGTFSKRTVK